MIVVCADSAPRVQIPPLFSLLSAMMLFSPHAVAGLCVTTESIQGLRGRRKLELRGRFLELFRVIQVRQYSLAREAHKTAYSIVFPSTTLSVGPEIDDRKDYQKPGEP